jgi:regulator of cell morphogenesis and NO signaling
MTLETQTVAEIAAVSLAAIRVLEQYGIDYCSGAERSLEQVCRAQNLEIRIVLADLESALSPEPEDDRDWTSAPLCDLMHHLASEHTKLREELPILRKRLHRVVQTYSAAHPALARLPQLFESLAHDLEGHMHGEERELFPAIERYQAALESGEPLRGSPLAAFGGPLHLMEQEHESAGAALRLLREFCRDHNVPDKVCICYRALLEGLGALEERLARHMYLENTVLYPRAAALKPARRQTTAAEG